jgi:3-methyladenine DNA glycosylase AlkD
LTAAAVRRRVRPLGDPERARGLLRFFKTGPGEYGEGDRFLGLTLTLIRQVEREFRGLPLGEAVKLLHSPWHEERTLALLFMVRLYDRGDAGARAAVFHAYFDNVAHINNWDLVDLSAPHIVGRHLVDGDRRLLRRLARSKLLWERRIAIVATLYFIRANQFADTLEIAALLLGERADLIHKATGWMLREVGKRDGQALRGFLDRYARTMPRTALRYAIERFPEAERRRYMAR